MVLTQVPRESVRILRISNPRGAVPPFMHPNFVNCRPVGNLETRMEEPSISLLQICPTTWIVSAPELVVFCVAADSFLPAVVQAPLVSKLVLAGAEAGCSEEAITVAAMMQGQVSHLCSSNS